MASPVQQTLTTTIQGIGKPKSGKGWMLTLAHQLAGSKYPTTLYGQDEGQVSGLSVGEGVVALIQKGNLKQGKDPKYDTSYYWDLVSIQKAGGGQTAAPGATQPSAQAPKTFPAPDKPYVPPAPQPQDVTRISIERQKAVAEARAGADFLLGEWFKQDRADGALEAQGRQPLPIFLDDFAPHYEALVARLAARFYQSIHGRME